MKYIQWLDNTDGGVSLIGGKAFNLRTLLTCGIRIPEGFCITTEAFDYFTEVTGISSTIRDGVSKIDFTDVRSVGRAATFLRGLINMKNLPADLSAEILLASQTLCKKQKNNFVAVRSSSPFEDAIDRSFAGQFDTFLCVPPVNVVLYVKKCWESMFTERAINYGKEYYLKAVKPSMAVIVQAMVVADKAGICFTLHPVTGDRNTIVIEAIWGIGDLIVSGVITPDHFEINAKTKTITERIGDKSYMSVLQKGELGQVLVPKDKRSMSCLSESELFEIFDASKNIEGHLKYPQDIEWAIADESLYILQARPITKLVASTSHQKGDD